jgi:hypothetical protein
MMRWLRWVPAGLVLLPWLLGPLARSNDARVRDLSAGVAFHLLDWETQALSQRAGRLWLGLFGQAEAVDADAPTLRAFFRRAADRTVAEPALERVVAATYADEGMARASPLPTQRLFPPLLVALTSPPNMLIVAPRTELRVAQSVVLAPMDVTAQERLEASVDSADVVALVAPIGGLATYPSMVLAQDSPERVVAAVAHEWLHQYLIFYPLGARYWAAQETREINETTADLVGQEIGARVVERYAPSRTDSPGQNQAPAAGFDFRAFMRETRVRTEQLLLAGQVADAEAYMGARRDELQTHGVTIRKLNQAYFALYGSYGGGFAASPRNPIPPLLRQLRERSGSLAEFVVQVREVTSVAQLRDTLAQSDQRAMLAPR